MNILIAEDDKTIANSLKKHLLLEDYHATIACDGEEALTELSNHKYELLLLDWRMPKRNGLQVITALRVANNLIPIILLTALNDISNKVEALKAGADDYITKPFSIDEVIARINAVTRRATSDRSRINYGLFSLNLLTHTIETSTDIVKLSEKEFELLNYLLANKGIVINRDTLYERVWGIHYLPSTNFVDVTIKNLRKKIEPLTNRKCIKSVYGEGYIYID